MGNRSGVVDKNGRKVRAVQGVDRIPVEATILDLWGPEDPEDHEGLEGLEGLEDPGGLGDPGNRVDRPWRTAEAGVMVPVARSLPRVGPGGSDPTWSFPFYFAFSSPFLVRPLPYGFFQP